ncbi:hypothetical protein HY029_02775 [Candidatus Gottesmanbacteria bacterium]|nr:hypothetical protein [Candidatus Gottesmanbacteria bacterium]
MKKLILFVLWFPLNFALLTFYLVLLLNFHHQRIPLAKKDIAFAKEYTIVTPSPIINPNNISPKADIRITVLQKFLANYDSPLTPLSSYLVDTADLNGLDYALIPAIAMQESGGCKVIPNNSYNCWGFGIYGSTVTRFASYEEAISAVAKTIKQSYIKNGLTNPTLLENIWAPQSTGQWSYAVNYFIGKIRDLEKNVPAT